MGQTMKKMDTKNILFPVRLLEQLGVAPWPFHPKTELVNGILKDECAKMMKDFFRERRKS